MTLHDDLLSLLELHGIDTTQYTESKLNALILEAKTLINTEYITDSQEEDFVLKFTGKAYMTEKYPLKQVNTITVDGVPVTPLKTRSSGIIYFDEYVTGKLEVNYIVGLTDTDYSETVLPICLYIAKDAEGQNISSISEGDVSVSYAAGSSATMIDNLVSEIRSKYGARVRLL